MARPVGGRRSGDVLGGSIEQDNWEPEALVETGRGINESLPLNLAEVEPRGRLDGGGGDLQPLGHHRRE